MDRGNKADAVRGFQLLQGNGQGTLTCVNLQRGASVEYNHMYNLKRLSGPGYALQIYHFEAEITDNPDNKSFIEKLMQFGISIHQYEQAYDVTM